MAFDDRRPQLPIYPPEAEAYARRPIELSRQVAPTCDCVPDIRYGDDYYLQIDIYRPMSPDAGEMPVLLFAHGGAWTNGYKEWMGLLGPVVTAFPAIFVSVSHRLAPEHRYPEPFHDCLAALGWVNRNIYRYGGNPTQLFVGGHSSGGHLYVLATLRRDQFRKVGIPVTAIKACFQVSARFNMVFHNPAAGTREHRHQSMLFSKDEDAISASPLHQLEGNEVPFLLINGKHDLQAIIENNDQMFGDLRARGSPISRLILEGHDHFDTALEIRHPNSPWMTSVPAWMLERLIGHASRHASEHEVQDHLSSCLIPAVLKEMVAVR